MHSRHQREARRDANYYALLCNLHGDRKRVWTADDFLMKEGDQPHADPEAAAANLAKYEAAMAESAAMAGDHLAVQPVLPEPEVLT